MYAQIALDVKSPIDPRVEKQASTPRKTVESFNGKLRDELLNRELFLSLEEARWVLDRWRLDYNHHRVHSTLDYQNSAELLNPILLLRLVQILGGCHFRALLVIVTA